MDDSNNSYPSSPYPYSPAYGYTHAAVPPNQYPHLPPYPGPYPYLQHSLYPTTHNTAHSTPLNYPYPGSAPPPPPTSAPFHPLQHSSYPYQYHADTSPPPPPSAPPQPNPDTFGSFQNGCREIYMDTECLYGLSILKYWTTALLDSTLLNVLDVMRGHLLKYPVDVDRKGKVKPLPDCETFPDVGENIVGLFAIQENLMI